MKLRSKSVALAISMVLAAPALADGLVDNVDGVTLTKDGRVQRFTGLVVGKDGNVVRLLSRGEKRPDKLDWRQDAKGQVMLPGLIDGHGHVMGLGKAAMTLDLSGTKTLAQAQALIAAYAAANPDRRWIIGRGWNQEVWGLGRFPTAADIDAVVADRPVWLERVDGHAGWANTAAMTAAGVTAASVSPPGGRIEKTGAKPGGVFVDSAQDLVNKVVPPMLPRELDTALLKAQELLLSYGITATADMGTTVEDWMAMRRLGDAGNLRVRIMSYALGIDTLLNVAGGAPTPWLYGDRLKMGGVKLYSDGALGSRGAWLKRPYADAPGQSGAGFLTDDQLRNLLVRASMDKFQVAVHAIGDRANAQALDAIEDIADTYKGDRRWRIEHAQVIDPADLARMGRNGIIASMQPVHETSDWQMAQARLGPDRLNGAYAWNTVLKDGGKLAFGSDYPVESPDPFAGLAAAISREDASGQPFGGWMPAERVSREAALAGFTTGAAYAGFAEDRIGRLAPGMRADFVLLNADPLTAAPAAIRAAKVSETWIGGKRVFVRK